MSVCEVWSPAAPATTPRRWPTPRGSATLPLIDRWADQVVADEDDVAEAMVLLLERAKLVVEGRRRRGRRRAAREKLELRGDGTTVVILSGGNVDAGQLAQVARRHESQAGRRLVLVVRIPDRPGALARLLSLVGERGANLLDVQHIREGINLHVRETRGAEHAAEVSAPVRAGGYVEARLPR
jgi:threonine dehydratase